MNDDDDLGIDLDAWQPPPPPGGIADAVVAQMRREHTSITTVTPVEPERRGGKRWWLVAIPLVAAATVGLVAFGIRRAPSSGQGTVVAEKPMHLELGPSSAELDPSTRVTWKRERYRITATQSDGAASWRVDDDDTLTIDAAVASIEATNASLRVEVKMIDANQKRTIATSAVTAAAVALVTIVVYEGAIKVTEAEGKTTQVAAGSTYRIKGPTVIEEEATTVGASTPELLRGKVEVLEAELASRQAEVDKLRRILDDQDEIELEKRDAAPKSVSRQEIQREMQKLAPKLRDCAATAAFDGKITATVSIAPSGTVETVALDIGETKLVECIAGAIKTAKFSKTKNATTFKYPLVFSNMTTKTSCDYDALFAKGQEAYATGLHGQALTAFEAAYHCRADVQALKLTIASACQVKNLPKARQYWPKLSESSKTQLLQICVRSGINVDDLNGSEAPVGTLNIISPKAAEVFVDGRRVGVGLVQATLSPGKHKVTLQIGDDRHSFVVNVKAGETVTLDKHALE